MTIATATGNYVAATLNDAVHTVTAQHSTSTLATPLVSARFILMANSGTAAIDAANRWSKHIRKGKNSKLASSVAVEIPAVNYSMVALQAYPAIVQYLNGAMQALENEAVRRVAVSSGCKGVFQYSELAIGKLAEVAFSINESSGIGQLSEERITNWFNTSGARDYLLVAIAQRLSIPEECTDADVKKCEQTANQIAGNLAKLASRNPVVFDKRVHDALNWALRVVSEADSEDSFAVRLHEKLNMPAPEQIELTDSLGF
jgi:hypothetical protein